MVCNTESQKSPEDLTILQDFVVLFLFFNVKMLKTESPQFGSAYIL